MPTICIFQVLYNIQYLENTDSWHLQEVCIIIIYMYIIIMYVYNMIMHTYCMLFTAYVTPALPVSVWWTPRWISPKVVTESLNAALCAPSDLNRMILNLEVTSRLPLYTYTGVIQCHVGTNCRVHCSLVWCVPYSTELVNLRRESNWSNLSNGLYTF